MKNVYIPFENVNDYACYSIRDNNTIRAYKNQPAPNSSSDYVDFYINSHYLENYGVQTWSNYNSNLPTCISKDIMTNNYIYRNDLADIFIIYLFIIGIPFLIVIKMIKVFFLGRKLY